MGCDAMAGSGTFSSTVLVLSLCSFPSTFPLYSAFPSTLTPLYSLSLPSTLYHYYTTPPSLTCVHDPKYPAVKYSYSPVCMYLAKRASLHLLSLLAVWPGVRSTVWPGSSSSSR
jgi:hypothetical protein